MDQINVSGPILARWLGVSGKVIYDLAKAGVIERAAGGPYALEASVRGYCEHVRGMMAHPHSVVRDGGDSPSDP